VVTDVILQLRRVGKTIFLNTHNLDEAQRICDRIGIIKTKLLTVSTPEELRKAVWGNKTVLQLAAVDDRIVAAVERLKPKNLVREGTTITVAVDNPLTENPELVQAVVAGGRVQYATELNPALEETYLRIMEEETRRDSRKRSSSPRRTSRSSAKSRSLSTRSSCSKSSWRSCCRSFCIASRPKGIGPAACCST
jgi:ABC-type multidrug transport system ATPase subunit